MLPPLDSRRLLFMTGKGGVGKTTVSAALGVALATQGKRVLIAMSTAKERLSAVLGTQPIGDGVQSVSENLWAVNIAPELALEEYGRMVLKVRAVSQAVFGNKYVKVFFRAVPGLHEWAILGKAWFHTTELRSDGSPRFDVVILDAPATGHGLDMLRVPKIILDVVPPGVLRRDAEIAWKLLRDPTQSGVVVTTIPEEMPTTETIELIATIRDELGLPMTELIVNAVLPALFTPEERKRLLTHPELLEVHAPAKTRGTGHSAVVAGARRAARETVQADSLARLEKAIDLPKRHLPFLFDEASTREGTHILAKELLGA